MRIDPPITELLASGKPLLSVEFFPPKNDEGGEQLLRTAESLRPYRPDFVSITYGAGGTTRERTFKYAKMLREDFGWLVMPHLTCVGSTGAELLDIVGTYHADGIRNIMALRGDPPKGEASFTPAAGGLRYASDLVALIRAEFPALGILVAGYPETHQEAVSPDSDLHTLVRKVEAGGDVVVTQLFYDNADFFRFRDRCAALRITQPIVPGVMPVTNYAQIRRIATLCKARLPDSFTRAFEAAGDDEAAQFEAGVEFASRQVHGLIDGGVPGIHFYVLNKSTATSRVLRQVTVR
jgi:methylenetetrahydrofolate reductase (NADPH)